jgi:hypothetical protein
VGGGESGLESDSNSKRSRFCGEAVGRRLAIVDVAVRSCGCNLADYLFNGRWGRGGWWEAFDGIKGVGGEFGWPSEWLGGLMRSGRVSEWS